MSNNAILSTGGGGGIGGSTGSVNGVPIVSSGTGGNTIAPVTGDVTFPGIVNIKGLEAGGDLVFGVVDGHTDSRIATFSGSTYFDFRNNIFFRGGGIGGTTVMTFKSSGNIIAIGTIQIGIFTVGTLPSASPAGQHSFVSDALAPAFGVMVVGSGAVFTPVYSDGTNWFAG